MSQRYLSMPNLRLLYDIKIDLGEKIACRYQN